MAVGRARRRPLGGSGGDERQEETERTETGGWSADDVLRGKDFAAMSEEEFAEVKALIRTCVQQRVDGVDATELITMAKLFCSRVSHEVADVCMQLHGGYGYMKESAAGRAFVDTRLGSIGGGSDETMMHYLARQLGF